MTMVETMAQAIGAEMVRLRSLDEQWTADRFQKALALAALKAMREPTKTMAKSALGWTDEPYAAWRDMIDAAIAEPKP